MAAIIWDDSLIRSEEPVSLVDISDKLGKLERHVNGDAVAEFEAKFGITSA